MGGERQDLGREPKPAIPGRIYPYNRAEYRDSAGRLIAEEDASAANATIWVWSEISAAAPASKQSSDTGLESL